MGPFSIDITLVLATCLGFIIWAEFIFIKFFSRSGIDKRIPWVGRDNEEAISYLDRARATLGSLLKTRQMVLHGFHKYSNKGLPFVLPNLHTGPEIILPPSSLPWLLAQPDTVLSQNEVNRQFLQADYTMLHPRVIPDTVHHDVIRCELTKGLGEFTGDVWDEVGFALDKNWALVGAVGEWKEVVAYDTMLDIIARISNRVFVGFPLCRDENYLQDSKNFGRLIVLQSAAISLIPKVFQPIFAPLINIADHIRYWRCSRKTVPIIKECLSTIVPSEEKKSDYIQWAISHSYNNDDPSERTISIISRRLLALQFAAVQSSTITLCNLLLDLASCPTINSVLETMRDEINRELAAEGGVWTKQALARMFTLDSAVRESLRLWGFVSRGVLKEVVDEDGIVLPASSGVEGLRVKKGTKLGIHATPLHRIESVYPEPDVYKPFRFVHFAEDGEGGNKGTPLVTGTKDFMAFSIGRHGCPGRFFASQQLKLVLAYIALNYEIEPIAERPPNDWFIASSAPPLSARIHVRRRQEGA